MEVRYILPAIRREFALALIRHGLPQKRVASMLWITGAAVSQYKSDKRATGITLGHETKIYVEQAAKRVIADPSLIFQEIMDTDAYLKQTGAFCFLHKLKSRTPEGCEQMCAAFLR